MGDLVRKPDPGIGHLDQFSHVVMGTVQPANGRTLYGGHCLVCGESFEIYDHEYAMIRLERFRQEPCPGD